MLGLQEGNQVLDDFFRFQHAPVAGFAAGLLAAAGAEQGYAVNRERGHVALRCRVFPHLLVHCRCCQQRAIAGQHHGRQQVICQPVCHLGQEVGRGRGNEDQVGFTREVDVRHVVGDAAVPLVGIDRAARERLEGHWRHEVRGAFGHHHLYVGAGLAKQTYQLRGLVGRDAAGDAEYDALSL